MSYWLLLVVPKAAAEPGFVEGTAQTQMQAVSLAYKLWTGCAKYCFVLCWERDLVGKCYSHPAQT